WLRDLGGGADSELRREVLTEQTSAKKKSASRFARNDEFEFSLRPSRGELVSGRRIGPDKDSRLPAMTGRQPSRATHFFLTVRNFFGRELPCSRPDDRRSDDAV